MEWITGRNAIREVLRAGRRRATRFWIAKGVDPSDRLNELLKQVQTRQIQVEQVARQALDRIDDHHQGVGLEVSEYPYVSLPEIIAESSRRSEPAFILVLDMLQNPQNLGTLLRTAEAVGVHGVLMPLARAAGITPAVVQASAGASEHLLVAPVNLAQSLTRLKEEGLWVVGLDGGAGARPPGEVNLDGPLALVVGNEGEGMRSLVRKSCDLLLSLPMRGQIESLNAAVAGSVVLYMARQWRDGRY